MDMTVDLIPKWTGKLTCKMLNYEIFSPAGYVLNIASIVSAVKLYFNPLHPSVCLMSD